MRLDDKRALLFWALPVGAFVLSVCATSGARPAATSLRQPLSLQDRPAETPRLDPTLRDSLLRALNPEPVSFGESSGNPFIDRAGVTREAGADFSPAVHRSPEASYPVTPSPAGNVSQSLNAPQTTPPLAERGRAWQQRVRAARAAGAAAPAITTVYTLGELEAVGRGAGGAAWLLIKPEERAFTARPGTRFYDAVLTGVDDQGVTFQTDEGRTHTLSFTRADR